MAFFIRWCHSHGHDAAAATQAIVLDFLAWYRRTRSQSSTVRRFAALRCYYAWLIEEGRRDAADDPTDGIRLKHPPHVPKRPFTADELRSLVQVARRPIDRAALLLLLGSGLRLGELASLRVQDVDFAQSVIRVHGKGNKQRLVAPGERAMSALAQCRNGHRSGAFFISQRTGEPLNRDAFYRIVRRVGRRAGVDGVTVRRFRTTFACLFARESNGDVDALQVLMGHAKIATTLQYAAWDRADRALERAKTVALVERLGV